MDKIKNADWIMLAIIVLSARSLIDFSFPQALVVLALLGYKGWNKYMETKQEVKINDTVLEQISEMRSVVSGMAMKNAARPAEMQKELKRFF